MPMRLDVALWGLSTAIAAMMSMGPVPNKKAATSSDSAPSREQYVTMKITTWTLDYVYMGGMLYILDTFFASSNGSFNPLNIFLHQLSNSIFVVLIDIIKGVAFSSLVPKAKTSHIALLGKEFFKLFTLDGIKESSEFLLRLLSGEGIVRDFSVAKAQRFSIRHQLWYFTKIGLLFIPLASAIQVQTGQMIWSPLNETVLVIGEGEPYETHVSRFLIVYIEYMLLSAIKDALSMNIAHQLFHSMFYSHHKTHHLPMRELSVCNAFYFDLLDLIAENLIGPLFVCGIKASCGSIPAIHYASYYLSVVCDQTVHSLDIYTLSFWNPLLDSFLRPALSHNLHHSTNRGHYTIWPMHQIKGLVGPHYKGTSRDGIEYDIDEYNKTFETHFPVDL